MVEDDGMRIEDVFQDLIALFFQLLLLFGSFLEFYVKFYELFLGMLFIGYGIVQLFFSQEDKPPHRNIVQAFFSQEDKPRRLKLLEFGVFFSLGIIMLIIGVEKIVTDIAGNVVIGIVPIRTILFISMLLCILCAMILALLAFKEDRKLKKQRELEVEQYLLNILNKKERKA